MFAAAVVGGGCVLTMAMEKRQKHWAIHQSKTSRRTIPRRNHFENSFVFARVPWASVRVAVGLAEVVHCHSRVGLDDCNMDRIQSIRRRREHPLQQPS